MIIALSIFALTLAGKLAYDYKKWLAGKKINHKKEAVIVFILLMVASFFTDQLVPFWNVLIFLACFLSIFWALFDSGFGLLIARNPFFLGESSWLDHVQKKEPALQVAKYLLAILSVLILIYA